jgi:transposase-like protein
VETGKDKRYFDREFKYETIRLMNEGKRSVRDICQGFGYSSECAPSVEA